MRGHAYINNIILLIIVSFLSACGSSTVKLNVIAGRHLNQDIDNESLPVVVRVYTLTSVDNFTSATFRELWHDDKGVLNDTLVSRQEFIVNPNAKVSINITHDSNAKYIAAVALFRHVHGSSWRALRALPGQMLSPISTITLELNGSNVVLK